MLEAYRTALFLTTTTLSAVNGTSKKEVPKNIVELSEAIRVEDINESNLDTEKLKLLAECECLTSILYIVAPAALLILSITTFICMVVYRKTRRSWPLIYY